MKELEINKILAVELDEYTTSFNTYFNKKGGLSQSGYFSDYWVFNTNLN